MLEAGGAALLRSCSVARWRCCAVALLRSGAVAQWRFCAVALLRNGAVALLRRGICCALQKGEGGGESENVKVKVPLKVHPLVVR